MSDVKKILTLLACCVFLTVPTTAWAEFVGVVSEIKTDADTLSLCGEDLGLTICNVYAQFDEDDDALASVAFADIQVTDGAKPGVFYQHIFGGDVPYSCAFLTVFPDLICDSYVTIGETCVGNGGTSLDGDFDEEAFNGSGHIVGGWFNSQFLGGQGYASNYPDGKVLLLQAALPMGYTLEGSATVFVSDQDYFEFFEHKVEIVCKADRGCGDCPTDVDGDGLTGPFDLASLLACWGPVVPVCECLDANRDNDIGPFDLATLLAVRGGQPCP